MQNYPIAGNRAMIDLRWCDNFPCDRDALADIIIHELGFKHVFSDPEQEARIRIHTLSVYKLEASIHDAPTVVDCSSFVKWVYAQAGISLPRPSIDQRACGQEVDLDSLQSGDLIFTTGPQNYFEHDPDKGVGHVGIATGLNTVIEASAKRKKVVETDLDKFLGLARNFRGARRILPPKEDRFVIELPQKHEVTYCRDIVRYAQKRLPLVQPGSP